MLSFLFNSSTFGLIRVLVVASVIAFALYKVDTLRKENYKLHTKIKQMEAIFQKCKDEKEVYELYCTTKQELNHIGIENVKKDNNDSVIFDFSRLQ